MKSHDTEWKRMFAAAGSCLKLEQIDDYLSGKGDDLPRKRVAEHLQSCPRCSAEAALYSDFQMQPLKEDSDVQWITARLRERSNEMFVTASDIPAKAAIGGEPGWLDAWRPFFAGWRLQGMALAAAALLLAVGIGLMTRTAPEIPIPNIQPSSELRSDSIKAIAPVGELKQVPVELQWESYNGAHRYRVRIVEVDGNLLWQGETAVTVIAIPPDVAARLVPGKKLLWQVLALDISGRVIVSSRETAFRMLPPQDTTPGGNR